MLKNTTALFHLVCIACLTALSPLVMAQEKKSNASDTALIECTNRGALDEKYCDNNRDLVADASVVRVNPRKLVLGISATEDAATARRTYFPLIDHLNKCTKREVELYPVFREGAVLEAQRNGIIQIGQYATGSMMLAVNFAGAVPFAAKGKSSVGRFDSYTLKLLVRADSTYKQPQDLVGKKIAHTSQSSNSGNLAPRALFPELGLRPEIDYKVEYSGGHEKSMVGLRLGLYDAAAIASDVLNRLVAKGELRNEDFRVLFESDPFPPDSFSVSNNLDVKLVGQIQKCFSEFTFPPAIAKTLEDNNKFYPINYRKDWQVIRLIAKAAGRSPDRKAYEAALAKK